MMDGADDGSACEVIQNVFNARISFAHCWRVVQRQLNARNGLKHEGEHRNAAQHMLPPA